MTPQPEDDNVTLYDDLSPIRSIETVSPGYCLPVIHTTLPEYENGGSTHAPMTTQDDDDILLYDDVIVYDDDDDDDDDDASLYDDDACSPVYTDKRFFMRPVGNTTTEA